MIKQKDIREIMKSQKKLEEQIKKHEGLRLKPYRCSAGKLTIGYGRNIEDRGISKNEAEFLLMTDIIDCTLDMDEFFGRDFFSSLTSARQHALIDLRFNIGLEGFKKFKKMIKAIRAYDFQKAADEMKDSKWYTQVGQRGITLVKMLREG